MDNPYAQLSDGHLPQVMGTRTENANRPNGTDISIKGFNNNQLEKFTYERIKDYIKWFTKFGSIETAFAIEASSSKRLLLKGLDRDTVEEISFGHFFQRILKTSKICFQSTLFPQRLEQTGDQTRCHLFSRRYWRPTWL